MKSTAQRGIVCLKSDHNTYKQAPAKRLIRSPQVKRDFSERRRKDITVKTVGKSFREEEQMNAEDLINAWKAEERIARIHGWDFSHIAEAEECYRPIRFFDVGALVWFAGIIEWEFPGFSVDTCCDRLLNAQRILERNGCIEGRIHRYLLAAIK